MSLQEFSSGQWTAGQADSRSPKMGAALTPEFDLSESEHELVISCDLPDASTTGVDVYVSCDNLVICGESTDLRRGCPASGTGGP